MKLILMLTTLLLCLTCYGQKRIVRGKLIGLNFPIKRNIYIKSQTNQDSTQVDSLGNFQFESNDSLFFIWMNKEKIDSFKYKKSQNVLIRLSLNYNVLTSVTVSNHFQNQRKLWTNPVAIAEVSAKQIDNTLSSNLIDGLVKNTPGLNAVKTGPNVSKPFIRGLGYNRVLTLFDGIRQEGQQWGDEHGIELDPYNIGNTQIIKGPASLIYGSDAEAGVVSLSSFRPQIADSILHGQILSEYQSNNGLYGNGFSLYKRTSHWFWLGSGSYRIAKNYQNRIDGRVYNTGFKETNLAFKTGYHSKYGSSTLNFTLYDNLQGIPDGSRDSLTRKFTKQIYESDQDDIKDRPIVSDKELNSYTLSPLHQHIQHYRIYTENQYSMRNGGYINVIGAFQQNIRREFNHPTDVDQAGMFVRLNTWTFTGKYTMPKMGNFTNTIGVDGMYQTNKNENGTDFPIPDYRLGDVGIYAFSNFEYGKWTISGGLRLDKRFVKSNDFYTGTNENNGFDYIIKNPADTAGANLQFPALNLKYSGLSASLGFTYEINTHFHIKANIARGYRAPNITETASNGLDPGAHIYYIGNRNFVPEFNLQEDIGAQMDLDEISGSLSLFNNNISNYISLLQLTDAENNPVQLIPGNWTYQYQQTSARLYGMESNIQYRPKWLDGFTFASSISLVYGENTNDKYKNAGEEGQYLAFIPPYKWTSYVEKNFQLRSKTWNNVHCRIETDVNGTQSRYFGLYGTESFTPGYTLLNMMVGTNFKFAQAQNFDVHFFVDNLLDKNYQSNLSRLKYFEYYTHSTSGHAGIYGMGRNFGIKLNYHF